MFVILSYDVGEKRVNRIRKITQKYLWRVHRSVYNGYLSEKKLGRLKLELKKHIVPEEDSVCIYTVDSNAGFERQEIGEVIFAETIIL